MKRLAIPILLSSILLSACSFSFTNNPDDAKGKLVDKGYTVEVVDGDQYNENPISDYLGDDLNIEYFLSAKNEEEKNYLFAWYLISIDYAETWFELNRGWFDDVKGELDVEFKSGQSNNVVWTGTNEAAKVAGFTLF